MCPRDLFKTATVVLVPSIQERRCISMLSGKIYVCVQTEVGPTQNGCFRWTPPAA